MYNNAMTKDLAIVVSASLLIDRKTYTKMRHVAPEDRQRGRGLLVESHECGAWTGLQVLGER
jgi:hypothetical protein